MYAYVQFAEVTYGYIRSGTIASAFRWVHLGCFVVVVLSGDSEGGTALHTEHYQQLQQQQLEAGRCTGCGI